ncbi:MAG: virginiamycin B lyase family protein [Xanthobacteraceae bacterium]
MTKPFTASIIAASVFALVPFAAQAQGKKPPALPEGAGKTEVEAVCAGCHATTLIQRSSGYTRDHWKELIATMIDLSPSADTQNKIVGYLAQHFPPNKARAPKLVPGSMQVSFKEYVTPKLGQRTRDPIQAADGTIWWVGQWGNLMGRLNPNTGEMKEYPLPANAMPHTVELDAQGRPWYTGNKNGTVGYIDPATGKATVFKMPDPNAKDPHTLVFDKNGTAWFSLQNSNMIGRLNPKTGEIKLVTAPQPGSKPYGVKIDAAGHPWVACNGKPCLLRLDPNTMAITEFKLPLAGTTVRRLDIAPDGMIWYVNSGKGQIGRLDPKTGQAKEWPSPSGPRSHPYGIVVLDGAIWYNESNQRPDALVRFDPKTETFQSWPIPSGNVYAGIWRHGRVTREGTILIHQSATNRIIEVIPGRRAAAR